MYIIHYTLTTGETQQSQPFYDHETADRLRRLLMQDPQVIEATVIAAEEAVLAT